MSEREYLARQAEQAWSAVHGVVKQMGDTLRADVYPRQWPQTHPWLCVGSAAATGFVAAWMLTPSSQGTFKQRLDELAAHVSDYMQRHASGPTGEEAPPNPSRIWLTIKKVLAEAVVGTLIASVRTLSANIGHGHQSVGGNGRHPEPAGEDYDFVNPT